MKAALIPLNGSNPIEIQKDILLVGRQVNCDLRIEHKTISKVHCIIVKTDGLLLIRDLGSTNGCRVNGQRITRAALLPNDVVSIAGFKYRVHLGPDDSIIEPEPTPCGGRNEMPEESADEGGVSVAERDYEDRRSPGNRPGSSRPQWKDDLVEPRRTVR